MLDLYNSPWKITSELRRLLMLPLIRLKFGIGGILWNSGWKIYGMPILQRHRKSSIEIGRGLYLRSFAASNPLGPYRPVILATRSTNASILIRDDVGITGGTICAEEKIEIGNRVLIGANCVLVDTDFHPVDLQSRLQTPQNGEVAPIIIEDDVFIGMNSLILKGVHIGRGSVIGAGSVISMDVPSGVVCAGNPARIIRQLGEEYLGENE